MEAKMIFPLEELIKFTGNIYEITCAASRRAYQLSMLRDPLIDENEGKVVSFAAAQIFKKQVQYRLEQ
jgi:DNA-directed RNA polymerase subunit omega